MTDILAAALIARSEDLSRSDRMPVPRRPSPLRIATAAVMLATLVAALSVDSGRCPIDTPDCVAETMQVASGGFD